VSRLEDFLESTKDEYSQLIDSLTGMLERLSAMRQGLDNFEKFPSGGTDIVPLSLRPSKTTRVSIFTLGRFYINSPNVHLSTWPNKRTESLLQLLLLYPNTRLDNDYLIEELALSQKRAAGLSSLRVTVHEVRKILTTLVEDDEDPSIYITSEHGSYRLNLSENVWVDYIEFEKACSDLVKPGSHAIEPTKAFNILGLYKGDLFQEKLYDNWTLIPRERLLDLYLNAVWRLAEHYSKVGDPATCIDLLKRLLEKDLLNEGAYELIIKSYMDLHRYSSALQWFEICKKNLRDELNIRPNHALLAMESVIKNGAEGIKPNS